MSILSTLGLGISLTAIGSAYTYYGISHAMSSNNKDDWDWQYKGKLFEDRVGNFSIISDNKSRYNDYLKGYNNSPKVGYSFDLSGFDVQTITNKRIIEPEFTGYTGIKSNNEQITLIGNPTGANTTDSNNYILENKVEGRSQFVTSYNNEKGRPNWVAFKMTKNNFGSTTRQNNFRPDPNLPSTFKIINYGDMRGFDTGHNANSAAFTSNAEVNSATYVMSNMLAEAHNLNAGPWADLEHYLNNKVHEAKGLFGIPLAGYTDREIQVITGGAGKGGIGRNGYTENVNGVEVPKVIWKVAIILEPGQTTITKDTKTISVIMPNIQNVKSDWRNYITTGQQVKKITGIERLFPALDPKVEEAILNNLYEAPKKGKGLLNIDDELASNFTSAAIINARSRGIHNPLLAPLFDTNKEYQGLVISNKRTHSEQFELARYNASMRASGRFTSVVDAEDLGTYESVLRASKSDGKLSSQERAVAKAFDYSLNTPSLMSRINEFFFIPAGMGRVMQEEKGPIPSLFGAIGGLIDQAYLTANPVLKSYKEDGENYFTTKTSFFQDLLSGSAAAVLATASSIGVYLAVGEPLKAMASRALLTSQEALIKAADTSNAAKRALGGDSNKNIGFKLSVIERQVKGETRAYYDLDNPTFSLYYLENYQRQRGAFFFSATAKEFLLSKVNPYNYGSENFRKLTSAVNDYLEVLQSPADIKIIDRTGQVVIAESKEWGNKLIQVNSYTGPLRIADAITELRTKGVNPTFVKEVNEVINSQFDLKITNVSLERNMELAKKIQAVINLVPMPWAWGIFAGRKDNVTAPMIGNLLDIEGFTRHVNASVNNQGFWGAANEYMLFTKEGKRASNPAFRIVNHLATITRSVLAFSQRGSQTQTDLTEVSKIGETYSQAQINIDNDLHKRTNKVAKDYVNRSTKGYDIFDTDQMDDISVERLLDNEAKYQDKWRKIAKQHTNLGTITLEENLYKYVNKNNNKLGFLLNHLDRDNSYVGMKISSSKLSAAKWIIGALFIPQLVLTEWGQATGASLLTSGFAQYFLNRGTTNTAVELHSTNFFSAAEIAKMMGADNTVANFVLGTQTLVSMAGTAHWVYNHASNNIEIHAKTFTGRKFWDSISSINNTPVQIDALTEMEQALGKTKDSVSVRFTGTTYKNETEFKVVRGAQGNIEGLKSLNAKVAKNWTSFSISLGLTLAAMQTARYIVSSAINNERNLMGSSVLATYLLGVPAVALAGASTFDNMAHVLNFVSGQKKGYSNYKVTSYFGNLGLKGMQGIANVFGKHPLLASIAAGGALFIAYWNKISPFQGDINGPKTNDINQTAILKLGSYVEQVNAKIDLARVEGGSTSISDSVSPLEVNAALLSIALGKIINPITSSQKGSTAYVTATQSPLPIFQYYSVIKKVVDSNQNSYTTIGLGLQGPPALGIDPINVSLPIAFAMNAKSADNINIRTGYFGTGLMLNENNKDSLSLQDYYHIYSQVALWSAVGITVSKGLMNNRLWGRNHQILKANGTITASESLLTQSLKSGRDKFLGIATLPFYIAAQSLNLLTGDLRMPSLRLRSTSIIPVIFSAFVGGAISNHLYSVLKQTSQPFKDKNTERETDNWKYGWIAVGATTIGGISYYNGTIAASRKLAQLESELLATNAIKFDKKNVDAITKWMYSSNRLKGLVKPGLDFFGGLVKKSQVTVQGSLANKFTKGFGLLAVGALWNHFITDPTVGKINPELAFGDMTKQTEDNYSNTIRRYTTVAFGAGLFALTAGLSTFNAKSVVFARVDPEQIVSKFRDRLTSVDNLNKLQQGNKKLTFLQSVDLKYQEYKLNLEAREVQIIIEEGMASTPIIQAVKNAQGKILKDAVNITDPYAPLKEVTTQRANDVYDALQSLDTSAGTDLTSIIKNNKDANKILSALDKFGDHNVANVAANRSSTLKALGLDKSVSNRIHVERWARVGSLTAGIGLFFHALNWGSQGFGYKDFQDALVGEDESNPGWWAKARMGIVDFVKLQTGYDRSHSYDITKGLVGPNLHNSKGEFLINPASTTKGAINNSLKQLSKLLMTGSPNTFIGVEVGGVTVRPDDNDIRVRGYFQLQSASQDFSSAMYSMSAVFGLNDLAKKGFLPQTLIANLRGVDDLGGHNQQQMRQFASGIISAVYSQPTRSGKDRLKFTAPDKFTLDAMMTNKALAMSLNQRYKRLQALSYGTNTTIALYSLLNNMNIASPEMQGRFYKALKDITDSSNYTGLGELNQNLYMGGGITVKQISHVDKNNNPFVAAKLATEESNNENAFMEMQGIAIQSTTNQYDPNKNAFDLLKNYITNLADNFALQGMLQGLPPFMWLPLAATGLATLFLVTSAIAITNDSKGQVTKDNTLLWEQQHKFYDEGKWYSKTPIEAVSVQGTNTKYLLMKRTGVVFNIAEGLDGTKINDYTSQINQLSGHLSMNFDGAYRDYAENYGQAGKEYKLGQIKKLDEFYDKLESKSNQTATRVSSKGERIARTHGREFTPIMFSESKDQLITYNNKNQKLTEHLLDEFTNKQILDAYLEGQYEEYKIHKTTLTKADFIEKYYKGYTFEQMLDAKSTEFLSKPSSRFAGGFNIFGKDRTMKMDLSIEHMTEVYASKFDAIIDNFFDTIDTHIDRTFQAYPNDNIYTQFSSNELNGQTITKQTEIEQLSATKRFQHKEAIRLDIKDRLTSIISTKKTGVMAVFDRLLNIVSGGTNRDLIVRMSLEAADASLETIKNIRQQAGGMFNGPGNTIPKQAIEEVSKAIEENIKQSTSGSLQGSMPATIAPKALTTTSSLTLLELLNRGQTLIMSGYQAAMFVSTNLITFRAAASIASSKTGQREKEMAREEAAKEGFEQIFAGLFFGTVLMSENSQKFGIPIAAGLAVGYIGYDWIFKQNKVGGQIAAGVTGLGLIYSSIALFKSSKHWGVSLGLAGLTLIGRSVFDASGSSMSFLSPEIGNYVTNLTNNIFNKGTNFIRGVQEQSGIINTIGGAALAIGGAYNFLRTGNPINGGVSIIGSVLGLVGLGHMLNPTDSRLEGASLAALTNLSQTLVTQFITSKVGQNIVAKTIASRVTEEVLAIGAVQASSNFLKKAAVEKTVVGLGLRGAGTLLKGGSLALRAVAGVEAGPWGLVATLVWTALEIGWILLHPESADQVASNVSHWGQLVPGGTLLLRPSNEIYNEARYKDKDFRNPLYQGTVNGAMKQEWLAQIDTLDDPTGRKTSMRLVSSFDAPMIGYNATGEGYGPQSVDPSQDLALSIRGKAYANLVTGRQFWNTRMSDKLNHQLVSKYMNKIELLQVQSWEAQINRTVEIENRKITSAPIIGSKQLISMSKEALNVLNEFGGKLSTVSNNVKEINDKNNLAVITTADKINLNKEIQIIQNGTSNVQGSLKISKKLNDKGQQEIEFNHVPSPNSEQIAIDVFMIKKNKHIDNLLINPTA